jgi:XTP/dITP diphosphohydrolase
LSAGPPRRALAVVATSNLGKLHEICEILEDLPIELRPLSDFPDVKMPEEGDRYAENAIAKARWAARETGCIALADDSGIEVEGLGGGPGPYSARYGGEGLDDEGRVAHLLSQLDGMEGDARRAAFVCVAALAMPDGRSAHARGECTGRIARAPEGAGGFGYDPIFESSEMGVRMSQVSRETKNRISHRARAFRALHEALLAAQRG